MSGWTTIEKIRSLEKQIDQLGFKFAKYPHGDWTENHNALSLVPKDADSLPVYSRDASIYAGSLEGLEHWLRGVEWARNYDEIHKLSNSDKRSAAEQKERNRQLMRTLKEGKQIEGVEQ